MSNSHNCVKTLIAAAPSRFSIVLDRRALQRWQPIYHRRDGLADLQLTNSPLQIGLIGLARAVPQWGCCCSAACSPTHGSAQVDDRDAS